MKVTFTKGPNYEQSMQRGFLLIRKLVERDMEKILKDPRFIERMNGAPLPEKEETHEDHRI